MSKNKNSKQETAQKSLAEYIIIALIFLAMALMLVTFNNREFSYKQYNTSSKEYVRAKVISINEEELADAGEFIKGYQSADVEIKQGKAKGRVVQVENIVTSGHNVILKKGARIIVEADMPETLSPEDYRFNVYNYDRSFSTFAMVILFLAVVVVVGGKKGFMSCLGLGFTLCTVVCLLLPSVFEGGNAIALSVITIILSTVVSCFCIGGLTKKTGLNIISTICGTLTAAVVYYLFMRFLGISGASLEEVESLELISYYTGLNISGVLIASVLVSSLGAVMDVAVSMCASLYEIRSVNPKITPKELFRSGMNIGKDMIGTMTNTLILAFAGSALAPMLLFIAIGTQFHQLISSNFLALEIASGISGSMAVVLTVPISAAICSFLGNKNKNKNKK